MVELDLKKLTAPDFTASIRPGMPALTVIDEVAVPSIYWEPGEPRLNRQGCGRPQAGRRDYGGRPLQSGACPKREDKVMGFSAKQVQALKRQPSRSHIRTREANGRELTYLEGWYAISEANRIFGFDGWSRETLESRSCWPARRAEPSWRSTSPGSGSPCRRTGRPSSERATDRRRPGTSPGEVHDIALKAAETDATKRALATFGNRSGSSSIGAARRPRCRGPCPRRTTCPGAGGRSDRLPPR